MSQQQKVLLAMFLGVVALRCLILAVGWSLTLRHPNQAWR
jgi:hypothetical protein